MINSSLSNDSFPPHLSFINPTLLSYIHCIVSNSHLFTSLYIITIVLILPFSLFIFYHALHQCRLNCSTSAAASPSHSDSFNCHIATMELICVCGFTVSCVAVNRVDFDLLFVGLLISRFTWYGETFFHMLTCVECYFAVVHPFKYLSVKGEMEIRIKIITTSCVWVLCFMGTALMLKDFFVLVDLGLMILSLIIISFCSLSVLSILIRPGPGEKGGNREKVDRSKLRAFYTIVTILGVLLLRFAWDLVWIFHDVLGGKDICLILTCTLWFNLPSSLTLPLLSLQRTGKFGCC